ncbi:Protein unc-45 -like protein A [Trichinella papuae]|uniref:Protein unc-45 homolog B n=1 Tax=Trichinella papuae TaxID=268474 RepID=A0A0V1MKJ4_9BILA|nr:Protein unc-45 -like protein A [Trichinella papuae]
MAEEVHNLKAEGNLYYEAGNWEKAKEYYNKALKACPSEDKITLAALLKNMAAVSLKLEDYVAAENQASQALECAPNDPKALYRRSTARSYLSKYSEALTDAKRALHYEPDNKAIIKQFQDLNIMIQKNAEKLGSTEAKLQDMLKICFSVEATLENRIQALHNIMVLVGYDDGARLFTECGGLARLMKLIDDESNTDLLLAAFRVLIELATSEERLGFLFKVADSKTIVYLLNCSDNRCCQAAMALVQRCFNTLSAMDFQKQKLPDEIVVERNKVKIVGFLFELKRILVDPTVSAMGRDCAIQLLSKILPHRVGGLPKGWSLEFVQNDGLDRLMTVGCSIPERALVPVTYETRDYLALCLTNIYDDMLSDKNRNMYTDRMEKFIQEKREKITDGVKIEICSLFTTLLGGPVDVAFQFVAKPEFTQLLLEMAASDDQLNQSVAVEAIMHTVSKRDRCSVFLAQGKSVLKKLFNSSNDVVRVKALVGLCKISSSGGNDISMRPTGELSMLRLANICKRYLLENKSIDICRWAAEGLAYLTLDADVKEWLVSDVNLIRRLVAFAKQAGQLCVFGVSTILVNLTNTYDKKEPEPELIELAKFAKHHIPVANPKDSDEYVQNRIKLLVNEGAVSACVALSSTESERCREFLARALHGFTKEPQHRGIVVQEGGVKLLIDLAQRCTEEGKIIAAHALARIGITMDPKMAFSGQRCYEVVKPIISLLHPDMSAEQNYEALLALTNLAAVSDSVRNKMIQENVLPKLEEFWFLQEHEPLRAASAELFHNLLLNDKIFEQVAKPGTDRLKLWLLYCSAEDDERLALISTSAMLMLTQDAAVCSRIVQEHPNWPDLFKVPCMHENEQLQLNAIGCVKNLMNSGQEAAAQVVSSELFEILVAICKLPKSNREKAVSLAYETLKLAVAYDLVKPTSRELYEQLTGKPTMVEHRTPTVMFRLNEEAVVVITFLKYVDLSLECPLHLFTWVGCRSSLTLADHVLSTVLSKTTLKREAMNSFHRFAFSLPDKDLRLEQQLRDSMNSQALDAQSTFMFDMSPFRPEDMKDIVVGPDAIAFLTVDGQVFRVAYDIIDDTRDHVNKGNDNGKKDATGSGGGATGCSTVQASNTGRGSGGPNNNNAGSGGNNDSNAGISARATKIRRVMMARSRVGRGGVIVGSRPIIPAGAVPEELVNEAQAVLQGKSRDVIIRELQRTNCDVNQAVNNLLGRDDEDGDDFDDTSEAYLPEELISLLDTGLQGEQANVIINAESLYGDDFLSFPFRRRVFEKAAEKKTNDSASKESSNEESVPPPPRYTISLSPKKMFFKWTTNEESAAETKRFRAIGAMHSDLLAVSMDGVLYRWAWNQKQPSPNPHPAWETICNKEPVESISCSSIRTTVLTTHRRVASFVDESLDLISNALSTSLHSLPEPIVDVYSCDLYSCAMTKSGNVYWWGVLPSVQRMKVLDAIKNKLKKEVASDAKDITVGRLVRMQHGPMFQADALGFTVVNGYPQVVILMESVWPNHDTARFQMLLPSTGNRKRKHALSAVSSYREETLHLKDVVMVVENRNATIGKVVKVDGPYCAVLFADSNGVINDTADDAMNRSRLLRKEDLRVVPKVQCFSSTLEYIQREPKKFYNLSDDHFVLDVAIESTGIWYLHQLLGRVLLSKINFSVTSRLYEDMLSLKLNCGRNVLHVAVSMSIAPTNKENFSLSLASQIAASENPAGSRPPSDGRWEAVNSPSRINVTVSLNSMMQLGRRFVDPTGMSSHVLRGYALRSDASTQSAASRWAMEMAVEAAAAAAGIVPAVVPVSLDLSTLKPKALTSSIERQRAADHNGMTPFMYAIDCRSYHVAEIILLSLKRIIRSFSAQNQNRAMMSVVFPVNTRPEFSPLYMLCCNDTCSFTWTGSEHVNQDIFECITCGLVGSLCCCTECAYVCHRNHECRLKRTSPTAYCDCWEKCKCRSLVAGNLDIRFELFKSLISCQSLYSVLNDKNINMSESRFYLISQDGVSFLDRFVYLLLTKLPIGCFDSLVRLLSTECKATSKVDKNLAVLPRFARSVVRMFVLLNVSPQYSNCRKNQPLSRCRKVFHAILPHAVRELVTTADGILAPVRLGMVKPCEPFTMANCTDPLELIEKMVMEDPVLLPNDVDKEEEKKFGVDENDILSSSPIVVNSLPKRTRSEEVSYMQDLATLTGEEATSDNDTDSEVDEAMQEAEGNATAGSDAGNDDSSVDVAMSPLEAMPTLHVVEIPTEADSDHDGSQASGRHARRVSNADQDTDYSYTEVESNSSVSEESDVMFDENNQEDTDTEGSNFAWSGRVRDRKKGTKQTTSPEKLSTSTVHITNLLSRLFSTLIREALDLLLYGYSSEQSSIASRSSSTFYVPKRLLAELLEQVSRTLQPTWNWLFPLLDYLDSHLRFSAAMSNMVGPKKRQAAKSHMSDIAGEGDSTQTTADKSPIETSSKSETASRLTVLNLLMSVMRSHSSEHGDSWAVLDLWSMKHVAIVADAYFCYAGALSMFSENLCNSVRDMSKDFPASSCCDLLFIRALPRDSSDPIAGESTSISKQNPFFTRSDSMVYPGLFPVRSAFEHSVPESIPLCNRPHMLQASSSKESLYGLPASSDKWSEHLRSQLQMGNEAPGSSSLTRSMSHKTRLTLASFAPLDDSAADREIQKSSPKRFRRERRSKSVIVHSSEAASPKSAEDTIAAIVNSALVRCEDQQMLMSRWKLVLSTFAKIFTDEHVLTSGGSIFTQLAGFGPKAARFRKAMERIRNTSKDLQFMVDRDRPLLLRETFQVLNAFFERRQMGNSSQHHAIGVHRVKVSFKDEPGEGSGVARSFFTAIASALLAPLPLPNFELSPLPTTVLGMNTIGSPSAATPIPPTRQSRRSRRLGLRSRGRSKDNSRRPLFTMPVGWLEGTIGASPFFPTVSAPEVAGPLDENNVQAMGNRIYMKVNSMFPRYAAKVTGMLLEVPTHQLIVMLTHEATLEHLAQNAYEVLLTWVQSSGNLGDFMPGGPLTSASTTSTLMPSTVATAQPANNATVTTTIATASTASASVSASQVSSVAVSGAAAATTSMAAVDASSSAASSGGGSTSTVSPPAAGAAIQSTVSTYDSRWLSCPDLPRLLENVADVKDDRPLFFKPGNGMFYAPVAGAESPSRLNAYRNVGRLIGIALSQNEIFPLPLCRSVFKFILRRPITWYDMAFYDCYMYEKLHKLVTGEYAAEDLDLNFTITLDAIEGGNTVELLSDGANVTVTSENVVKYVFLYAQHRLYKLVQSALTSIRDGVRDVIPVSVLDTINAEDFRLLLTGQSDVNVKFLKKLTVITDESSSAAADKSLPREKFDQFKKWFWSVVSCMTADEKQDLIYFWTGSPTLPPTMEGFMPTPNVVIRPPDDMYLPTANTCISRLYIPLYSSKNILRQKLLFAIKIKTFGFNTVRKKNTGSEEEKI